jgi:DNA topoisomerase I
LPGDLSPLDVTLQQALDLLAQPKQMRRGFGAPKEPLKTFGESPVTKSPVKLLEGRYGPYVTDGTTNASLPKGAVVEELTIEQALELLAARALMGPPKKGRRAKTARARTASTNGAATKTAKKAATAKKPAAKKKAAARKKS